LQDALLHAIFEEYVEGVEYLLEWEENHHKPGEPYVSNPKDVYCIGTKYHIELF
jgi:hypothetical protein